MAKGKIHKKAALGFFFFFLIYGFYVIFAPASWQVYTRFNKWTFVDAAFLMDREDPLIIVHAHSRGGYRAPDLEGLAIVNLNSKSVVSSYYDYHFINCIGITKDHIWIMDDDYLAFKIPSFELDYNLSEELEAIPEMKGIVEKVMVDGINDSLRIIGLDGYEYVYHKNMDKPKKLEEYHQIKPNFESHLNCYSLFTEPRELEGEKILEGEWFCNLDSDYSFMFENGDQLITHKTLKGEDGKFLLSRVDSVQIKWQLTEDQIKEKIDIDEPRAYCGYLYKNSIYTFFQDADPNSDFYLAELDPDTGIIRWALEVF